MKKLTTLLAVAGLTALSNGALANACFSCHGTGQAQQIDHLPAEVAFEAGVSAGLTEHYNVREYMTVESKSKSSPKSE